METRNPGIAVFDRMAFQNSKVDLSGFNNRFPRLSLTPKTLFEGFRGVDGKMWPEEDLIDFQLRNELASPDSLEKVKVYAEVIKDIGLIDLIGIGFSSGDFACFESIGFSLLGYDVGYFDSDGSNYSAILGEIFWCHVGELEEFASRLNSCFLFDRMKEAEDFSRVRNELDLPEGLLESWDVYPISVFALPQ